MLGESLDDAAGEAFDKTAKLLGLGYPGGPALAQKAAGGDPGRFHFPRPMTDRPGLDFSFSGLKTFALTTLREQAEQESEKNRRLYYTSDVPLALEAWRDGDPIQMVDRLERHRPEATPSAAFGAPSLRVPRE